MRDDVDVRTKWMILLSLFVTCPIIFAIDIFVLYSFYTGNLVLSRMGGKAKASLFLIFVFFPLVFIYFFKIAKDKRWIFPKK